MKKLSFIFIFLFAVSIRSSAQVCDSTANIVLFSNYDGGILNINVDVNIPNLKIGVVTYENVQINISGAFVNNVVEVVYAGFNANNNHCTVVLPTTTINGVPSSITSILFAPPATLADPNGNSSIICAYSCVTGAQGGCNTYTQILNYFSTTMNGAIYSYTTQYGCWPFAAYNISAGGNCCAPQPVSAAFTASSTTICAGECVNFTDQSTGTITGWSWSFPGSSTPASTQQSPLNICYPTPGIYPVTLTTSNATLNDTYTDTIMVGQAFSDTVNASICLGDSYTFPDGTTSQANTTNVSSLTGAFGCDSIITTNLSVLLVDTSLTWSGTSLTVNVQLPQVQWVDCNAGYAPVVGQNGFTFTPGASGNYAAILTSGGCTDTSGCYAVVISGIGELAAGDFTLYPNPVSETLVLQFGATTKKVSEIILFDNLGREVAIEVKYNASEATLDVSKLAPGRYEVLVNGIRKSFVRY